MSKITPVISDFTRGELSPRMEGRSDSPAFYQGVSELQNMIVLPQGGVEKRTGTKYVGTTADITKASRLVPFSYSDQEKYILEFHDGGIRVFFVSDEGRERIQTVNTLTLDVAPATPWPYGTQIYGVTSGAKARVLQKQTDTYYFISEPDDDFALGEVINGQDADGATVSAAQGPAHPVASWDFAPSFTPVFAPGGTLFFTAEDISRMRYVQAGSQIAFATPTSRPKILTYYGPEAWIWELVSISIPEWRDVL